ncbi:hypothetical protein A5782_24085 [Mycobacterium sp. 852002-40037_SCH5390672]|nr:hypothetical protein A5782_24085 [Mycobacterium sp. 852002-40037_SCH5390672]
MIERVFAPAPFEEEVVDSGVSRAEEADQCHLSPDRDRPQRLLDGGGSADLDDAIDATAISQSPDLLTPLRAVAVVDDIVGARSAG